MFLFVICDLRPSATDFPATSFFIPLTFCLMSFHVAHQPTPIPLVTIIPNPQSVTHPHMILASHITINITDLCPFSLFINR